MSMMEKIGSLMKRPGEDIVPKDQVPWWLKYSARAVGSVGGGIAIFLGVWNCLSIFVANLPGVVSGLLQMVAGFLVIAIEAPCCCMFIDYIQTFSDWVDKRPYWNRAVLYGALAIVPVVIDFGMTSLLGCGLIFVTGVLYGMMALGKKGSVEEMRAAAAQDNNSMTTSKSVNLVASAAPMGNAPPPV